MRRSAANVTFVAGFLLKGTIMNKYAKILNGASGTYPRNVESFVGLDCASEASNISPRRMAHCVNMWRDYESENGSAIETMPGWRRLISGSGRVNGIFGYRGFAGVEYLLLHIGKQLYRIPLKDIENVSSLNKYATSVTLNDSPSVFFESNGRFYLLDGVGYYCLDLMGRVVPVTSLSYVPVTYYNGLPYQQRNMLTADFIERSTVAFSGNKAFSAEPCWKYELISEGGDGYLKLTGIADGYRSSELISAYIPEKWSIDGTVYPIKSFSTDFFDLLPHTVQLVVDAPLEFFGASGGRFNGSISGMTSLERLVIRNSAAKYEFNACDLLVNTGGSMEARSNAPLRELWIDSPDFVGFGAPSKNTHEYSNANVGITSAFDGRVTLYVSGGNEMWGGEIPTKTDTVNGVIFSEERTGDAIVFKDVKSASLKSAGGVTFEFSAARAECTVHIDPRIAYSHVHVEVDGRVYAILVRDSDTGFTCEENGKWLEYTVYEPFRKVKSITVDGAAVTRYKANAAMGKAAVFIPPSADGGTLDIVCEGYPNRFSTVEGLTTVYDNGFSASEAWEAINKCTVVCAYDGRVFFTGNPNLPNTVFFSGRGLNGENDPTYIGIYNYVNDGIGNVPNTAMVASASMLAVLKGDISTDACAYYHVAQYNTDKGTADLLPRIYPSTEGVSNIPCVGAACNFADDIVFLSSKGLEGVEKQSLNLERTLSHRSGRVDPVLRKGLSSSSRMAEWKGYLCILNSDGTMLMADSRAINVNESTGEAQYEWFMLEGVGSYSGDSPKWEYGSGTVKLTDADGDEVELPLDGLTVNYGGGEYPVRIGSGEVPDGAEVISFGTVSAEGAEYTVEVGMSAVLVDGCFCPVEESDERVGGTFHPATALFEFRDKLYFGTENGDLCVFNTDKRSVSYDEGEEAGIIGSRWYDRCGHRYESGFATLSDDCGYPQFAKSTVGKTLTIRAKRMPSSAFTLAVRSEREDWKTVESFTATDNSFYGVDFANFSFEDNSRSTYSSSEKLKRWGEKQMYFYSDGFRQPFGIYGISYCYSFAGRLR